ncbi:MASE4 domain-containing protein, partial [Methylobacterium trifolii]
MPDTASAPTLPTLATAPATRRQRLFALGLCALLSAITLLLLPVVGQPVPSMPGFVPSYQAVLVTVYAVTSYLFLAQYRRTRSVPLLVLGMGSLYTTLIVAVQMLSFPNLFGTGRILGSGPDTTTWLWTFWHLGPPLFALPYAIMEGDGRARHVAPGRVAGVERAAILATCAVVGVIAWVVARHVDLLPKSVAGDDYWLLTTSGIGPAVVALTMLALVTLCWTTRLRSVLQLWLAVSLFLLILDNAVTLPGAARGTVGWLAGRMEALLAGIVLLCVYLREVDLLYGRAERTAEERERQRLDLQRARDHLALALDAADMGDWELDLTADTTRRTLRHDRIFGYDALQPRWGRAELLAHVLPDDRPAVEAAFARALSDGHFEVECRIARAGDG